MSGSGRKKYTTGEITNMMAVDSQRITDFMGMYSYLWSGPLQIIIAMVLLWRELGVATLAGIAFMVILMPIHGYITAKVKGFAQKIMKMKDKRVKLMNEILNGIKVFKLYAWETSFSERVFKFRQQEVNHLNKIAYARAFMSFNFTSAPFFVSTLKL